MARFSLFALFSILASTALAGQHNVLLQREETIEKNSPLYNCHLACGTVFKSNVSVMSLLILIPGALTGDAIVDAESDNYCSTSNFTSDLSTCLKCAETCEIWQYYGTDVAYAAGNCSDSATPSSSSSASSCASTVGSTSTATNTAAGTAATTTSVSSLLSSAHIFQ